MLKNQIFKQFVTDEGGSIIKIIDNNLDDTMLKTRYQVATATSLSNERFLDFCNNIELMQKFHDYQNNIK